MNDIYMKEKWLASMQGNRKKSLKLNMVLYALKGIMGVIFPLMTFPYISRVLGVELVGKHNFASSIISYVVLFAGLGINVHAIREGAKLRDDKKAFSQFADEVFSINLISTVVSYAFLLLFLLVVPKFHDYTVLLVILSLQVIFKTIGIEWIYSIYEDYAYITIRSISFQLLSLVLLFIFVRTKQDLNNYALITVVSSVGSNVLNYFHAKKYCKVNWTPHISWKTHFKPIMVLFATTLTISIYVSSGLTILGFLCGDKTVGIYSVSVNVYSIVKTVLSAVAIVSIPRLSAMVGKKESVGFEETANDIYSTLLTIVLPAVIGIILLRREIVLLIAGREYIEAASSLSILAVAMFFCMGAYFWGQCILVPLKEEATVLKITVISALVNIVLNFVLIPEWKENAAAFTTVIAESIAYAYCMWKGRKYVKTEGLAKEVLKIMVGCASMVIVFAIVQPLRGNTILYSLLAMTVSCVVFFTTQVLLKNKVVINAVWGIRNNFKRKCDLEDSN